MSDDNDTTDETERYRRPIDNVIDMMMMRERQERREGDDAPRDCPWREMDDDEADKWIMAIAAVTVKLGVPSIGKNNDPFSRRWVIGEFEVMIDRHEGAVFILPVSRFKDNESQDLIIFLKGIAAMIDYELGIVQDDDDDDDI